MDKPHEWLAFVNTFLREHSDIAFYTKIGYNLLIDINLIMTMIHWVFISRKW